MRELEHHGMSRTRIYHIYIGMKYRCSGSGNNRICNYYRDRGIRVCDEWSGKNGFERFYAWAMMNGYTDALTLDRIDNNGNYSPTNCRWVSHSIQNTNRRSRGDVEYIGVRRLPKRGGFSTTIKQDGQLLFKFDSRSKNECARKRNEFIIANNLQHPLNEIKDELEEYVHYQPRNAYVVIDKKTGEIKWFDRMYKLSEAVHLTSRYICDCINGKCNSKKYRFYRVKADDNNY